MTFPELSVLSWILAALAGLCVGVSKAGFSGVGMLTILFMAEAVGELESTGVVLPMLILADVLAVRQYRHHADWRFIGRLLPPALIGIVAGWMMMPHIPGLWFRKILGVIILAMAVLQWIRTFHGRFLSNVPDSRGLAWCVGGAGGFTTMLANAAGPITSIYLLMMRLPKYEFVGTSACFFMVVNIFKIPFSANLGLINATSLPLNLILAPLVVLGFYVGNAWLKRISQAGFEQVLLVLASLSALRFIFF